MIEIELHALFERELGEALVIVVLLEDDDVCFRKRFDNAAGDGGLAGAGASADADDEGPRVEGANRWLLFA